MCGPLVPWDWLVIDVSYVLALLGGALVCRARNAGVGTWMAFGGAATFVGVLFFTFTLEAQTAFAAASSSDPKVIFASGC